jgi:Predicted membrane protein (DUF2207)
VLWTRIPPRPPTGPRTLDLGAEPPALANLLVHDFRVTDDALPATVIDLAARNVVDIEQRGPDVFYVRLRQAAEEGLTAYERRVLEHLRRCAREGVVPAAALTTGPESQSAKWRRAFADEVVADAKARGLSEDAVGGGVFYALTAATAIPGVLIAIVGGIELAGLAVLAGVGLLGWIRARHPQRETPAGLDAASRWLGVRAELAQNEVFRTYSPSPSSCGADCSRTARQRASPRRRAGPCRWARSRTGTPGARTAGGGDSSASRIRASGRRRGGRIPR